MVENKPIIEKLIEFNKILMASRTLKSDLKVMTKLYFCYILYQDLLSLSILKNFILYGKEYTTTLEEVQAALRTNELTKFKKLKVDDSCEGLHISKARSESRGKGKRK